MKIAINTCFGGFTVSREVVEKLRAKGHKIIIDGEFYNDGSGPRTDGDRWGYHIYNENFGIDDENHYAHRSHPDLIKAIEESKNPSGSLSKIEIVEIPDNVKWEIDDYNGMESVHETHRIWS